MSSDYQFSKIKNIESIMFFALLFHETNFYIFYAFYFICASLSRKQYYSIRVHAYISSGQITKDLLTKNYEV